MDEDYKNRVEAVLFTTGRFMDAEEIMQLCGVGSIGVVKDALNELAEFYNNSKGALHVYEEKGKYKLNIKRDYTYLTTKLLESTEFDNPTQQTLALIAYKQPVLQADIIKMRGNNAYDHIKILREAEFIVGEKHGRSRMLKLAPKFFDYFDVVEDKLKGQFEEIENKVLSEEVQKTLKDKGPRKDDTPEDAKLEDSDPNPDMPVRNDSEEKVEPQEPKKEEVEEKTESEEEESEKVKDNTQKQGQASFVIVKKHIK